MKIYIKSNRNQHILDNLVDGNKLWNVFTGEYETLSEEQLEELRNPKPIMLPDFKLDTSRTYKNGKMWYRAVAGEHPEDNRVYRNAGRYKIFINSYPDAGLPYSILFIADSETGKIYREEITQGMGDFRRDLAELVEWLREGNTLEGV